MCKKECIDGSFIYIYEISQGKFHAIIYYPEAKVFHDPAFKKWRHERTGIGVMFPCNSIYLKGGD